MINFLSVIIGHCTDGRISLYQLGWAVLILLGLLVIPINANFYVVKYLVGYCRKYAGLLQPKIALRFGWKTQKISICLP